MRLALLLLAPAIACHASDSDYPVGGGGGGGGGGTLHNDAAIDGAGSGSAIVGVACVLTDPRDLTSCLMTDSGGLTVTLGSASATTAADGTFTIARPSMVARWDVTGSGTVVESVSPLTAQTRIPVMGSAMFDELQGVNGVLSSPGTGALLVRIVRGGQPVQDEVAALTPANDPYVPFYDPPNATDPWTTTATGPLGTVYLPGAITGSVTLTLGTGGTTQGTISGIPITDGGVTFLQAELL